MINKSFKSWLNLFVLSEDEVDDKIIKFMTENFDLNNQNEILDYLRQNKITPFGAHLMMKVRKNSNDKIDWAKVHSDFFERNSKILLEITRFFGEIKSQKINGVILFENFGTLLLSDACLGCFASGDVDLTADFDLKEVLDEIFRKLGYKKRERRDVKEHIMSSYCFENFLDEFDFWINVEWKPIARNYIHSMGKMENRLKSFRKDETVELENEIVVLNQDAMMYFNLLHVSVGHYYNTSPGIRLYIDIDRLARSKSIDWKRVFSWAKEDNQEIRIFTAMYLCRSFLGTPLPEYVLDDDKSKKAVKLRNFLFQKDGTNLEPKKSVFSQVYIDLLSEDVKFFNYVYKRIIRFNRN